MSTDLLFAEAVSYTELMKSLPEGIEVKRSYIPDLEKKDFRPLPLVGGRGPLYTYPIEHALLRDKCGNGLWVRSATQHDLDYDRARTIGEAAFEHFGMQGDMSHFGLAFEAQGRTLIDAVFAPNGNPRKKFDVTKDYGLWSHGWIYPPEWLQKNLCGKCSQITPAPSEDKNGTR